MNTQQKKAIQERIKLLIADSSQNKVSKKAEVSNATISQLVNNNWDDISDEMWRRIKANLRIDLEWHHAETTNTKSIFKLLKAAQSRSISLAISHNAGAGKSHSYKLYERTYENVIYIECKNYWTKKSFVKQLLIGSGLDNSGTIEELIQRFTNYIIKLQKPLVIIDQADKLKDSSLDLFMDFYNDMDGACGFMLSGVPALKKRIERGCQHDKIGYREIKSRIGNRFIKLDEIKHKDVKAICEANGLTEEHVITEIYNECEGDLRRVKRSVEQYFILKQVA